MNENIDILGVSFSSRNMKDTVKLLDKTLDGDHHDSTFHVATANPEFVMMARKNRQFRRILKESSLVTPDGIGVVLASRLFGTPLPERVAGYDTLHALLSLRNDFGKKTKIYCVGAKQEVIELAVENLRHMYSEVEIVGFRNGYFKSGSQEEKTLVEDISSKSPDLVLVGLGAPRQEEFIYTYKNELSAKVSIGVGGSFDVVSGIVKRAPLIVQKLYLEWLWRIIKQPSRWRRQLSLPLFAIEALKEKLKK